MSSLALSYATLILVDAKKEVTEANLAALLKAVHYYSNKQIRPATKTPLIKPNHLLKPSRAKTSHHGSQ